MIIEQFNKDEFIANYWQQKPCIIRAFLPDYKDPISEEHLAGLAEELDIDSRIVSFDKGQWHVEQGPINNFKKFCKGKWTILVQGVDKFIDNIDYLTDLVRFIPHWRLDDVMVSYSVEGGGVGPHLDEYDVFILQGKGSRRWQVGLPSSFEENIVHPLLKQIKGFEPVIDEVLRPGDVVYIPPKHPHNGVALEPCMNYSIGFRAHTDVELLTGIIDEHAFENADTRYTDNKTMQQRSGELRPGAITALEMKKIKDELASLIFSKNAESAIVQYLSRQSLPDYDYELSQEEIEEVDRALASGATLLRQSGIKAIYAQEQSGEEFEFFVNGERFSTSIAMSEHIQKVVDCREIHLRNHFAANILENDTFSECLKALLLSGYWDYKY
ncbi:cupin domain-containing protein [Glaciecola sp. MH2013]|uniref:cupin domain-containing protein n=1 Tax=Glaciecola sp. MH2013 TaxID=2785524 RepID=UPI00189F94C9|nr:cupin domain-containing protein [Glaciecola sp. MH2013]MBF7072571.1 cupin domain-containing protein [Glaciecola sp. MH2013]